MDDEVVGAAEAARILGVTSTAVRWTAGNGRLPRARHAFRRADVLALAASRPAAPPDDRSIGSGEAARILGVNPVPLLNRAKRGLLPSSRRAAVGGTPVYRFDPADIAAFVERSRVRPRNGADDHEPADG